MDTLFLYNTKTLKEKFTTKVFAGDNHITKINVQIPDNIGGYPKRECEYNLRAIIPEGNLSYMIDPSQPYFYITNDITEKAQTVKLMMIITHEGNVIGRTNTVDLVVNEPAEASDPPLTPREEFDEVIAEQRAEIAEQAETISAQTAEIAEKDEEISEKSAQITELSGEVTELETENTRLSNLTETQRQEIQHMIDNPPQPKLYTPPDPIEPRGETRVVTAPSGYDGLGSVTFLGTDYMNVDLQKWLSRESEEPFEVIFNSNIGDYLCYSQTRMRKAVINCSVIGIRAFQYCSGLEEVVFSNNLTRINSDAFRNCSALYKIIIPSSITYLGETIFASSGVVILVLPNNIANLNSDCFRGMGALTTVNIPSSIISIGSRVFHQCGTLQFVTIGNGFNANGLNLSVSTLYSVETIVSWLEALADRTGQTAYTLTMGTTNLNKLTAEQRAIAINKNWNLA